MIQNIPVRKIIVYTIYILLFTTIQISFPDRFSILGQTIDIMLVFVVLTAYFYDFKDGAVVGLIVGLIRDTFTSPAIRGIDGTLSVSIGLGMLLMFVAAAIASSFFTKRMNRNIPFAFVSVAFITLIYKVVGHLMVYGWVTLGAGREYGLTMSRIILTSVLPQILGNLIAAIPLIFLLRFLGPYSRNSLNKHKENTIKYGDDQWLTI